VNYAALMRCARLAERDNLGGKLLYAGALDNDGKSLAATADQAAGRQAMRDGAVDFVVTTLDEALRILKNQVRKREPVSVCVVAEPESMEREMLERGVEPDLLPAADCAPSSSIAEFIALGARRIEPQPIPAGQTLFTVEIPLNFTRDSGRIEGILSASIAESDIVNRRWLRLSPRYLGPNARRVRSVVCEAGSVRELSEQLARLSS